MVALVALSGVATAQPDDPEARPPSQFSQAYDTCMDKSGGITNAMLDCSAEEQRRQDARLNQAYKKVMDASGPERKQKLREVERAWIAYRDTSCSLLAEFQGGTVASLAVSDCVLQRTAERAKWLVDLTELAGSE